MSDLSVEIENIPSSSIKGSAIEMGESQTSARCLASDAGRSFGPSNGWRLGRLDDQLVAGAVPSDKNNAKLSAQYLGIASDRAYLSIPKCWAPSGKERPPGALQQAPQAYQDEPGSSNQYR